MLSGWSLLSFSNNKKVSLLRFGFFHHSFRLMNDIEEKIMRVMMGLLRTGLNYFLFIFAVIYFGSGSVMSVFAQQGRPCTDDVAKFCKGVRPGGGAVAKCLQEHENDLSPACKEQISKTKQKIQEFKEAC